MGGGYSSPASTMTTTPAEAFLTRLVIAQSASAALVRFLAGMASSIGEALAGDHGAAVREAERQLDEAIKELHAL